LGSCTQEKALSRIAGKKQQLGVVQTETTPSFFIKGKANHAL
jgi:hypothetical protein